MDWFDRLHKIATILIAAVNTCFVIYFLVKNWGASRTDKERDRRIQWTKTLILDHSLDHYYDFFDQANATVSKFVAEPAVGLEAKSEILSEFTEICGNLRKNFLDLFLAINPKLYDDLLSLVDKLQEEITATALDQGINISHRPKCDELVFSKIRVLKGDMMRRMFEYNGD